MKVLFNKLILLSWIFSIRYKIPLAIPFCNSMELSEKEINMVVHIVNGKFKDMFDTTKDYIHLFNFLNGLLRCSTDDEIWQDVYEEKQKMCDFFDKCKKSIMENDNLSDEE